jgi:hypothetical protein
VDEERNDVRAQLLNEDMTEKVVVVGQVPNIHRGRRPPGYRLLLVFPSDEVLSSPTRLWRRGLGRVAHGEFYHSNQPNSCTDGKEEVIHAGASAPEEEERSKPKGIVRTRVRQRGWEASTAFIACISPAVRDVAEVVCIDTA